jgi:hypothetical protein
LEPLLARGFQFTVNSAFRNVQGRNSQHEHGQAADLFFNTTNNGVFEIAKQIRDSGIPFGQLILEFPGRRPWIHVSYPERNSGSPYKVATMSPAGQIQSGLNLYT